LPLLATFRRQSLQKFEMAGADQIQDSTATESKSSPLPFLRKAFNVQFSLLLCQKASAVAKLCTMN